MNQYTVYKEPLRRGNHVGKLGWYQLATEILKTRDEITDLPWEPEDRDWCINLKKLITSLTWDDLQGLGSYD